MKKQLPHPGALGLGSAYTGPQVESISDWLSSEPAPITIPRDGDIPLHFDGWLIGQSDAEYSRVDVVSRVFLTITGSLVVATAGRSKHTPNSWAHATAAKTAGAALAAWKEHTKGKLSKCALEAWEQACDSLPFLSPFGRAEV